jgi:hypothetical protein
VFDSAAVRVELFAGLEGDGVLPAFRVGELHALAGSDRLRRHAAGPVS